MKEVKIHLRFTYEFRNSLGKELGKNNWYKLRSQVVTNLRGYVYELARFQLLSLVKIHLT